MSGIDESEFDVGEGFDFDRLVEGFAGNGFPSGVSFSDIDTDMSRRFLGRLMLLL